MDNPHATAALVPASTSPSTLPYASQRPSLPSSSCAPGPSTAQLVARVKEFVKGWMAQYDASHDYTHIERVLHLATHILKVEAVANPATHYDPVIVALAALMHDVGDLKYQRIAKQAGYADPDTVVLQVLLDLGASLRQAMRVQTVVQHVSYSRETRDLAYVRRVLHHHPELAIVQDADRLDAIGAVGIGRAFIYGAANKIPTETMNRTVKHFGERLERLEHLIKTEEGRRLATERTERLRLFREWWEEETNSSALHHCSG